MGLFLAAILAGEPAAQAIQLQMEYEPQPPFQCGSPERVEEELLEEVEAQTRELYERRREQCRRLGAFRPHHGDTESTESARRGEKERMR